MHRNVGTGDRIVRALLGIALLIWGAIAEGWWGLAGFLPVCSALIGFCPFYALFNHSTVRESTRWHGHIGSAHI